MSTAPDGRGEPPVRVGVIGVGSMGRHHARAYSELPSAKLVGIADDDAERAAAVAAQRRTRALSPAELIEAAEAVSVVVPTAQHYAVARECIAAGVHVLVEKPFVASQPEGRELAALADRRGVTIQVGHIERFNPAVRAAREVLAEREIIAIDARRLGPPSGRTIEDSAVLDLMIHDIDILLSLVEDDIESIDAVGTHDNRHASAQFRFESGVVATLTASRLTRQKVRRLAVTAHECQVNVDYTSQSVEIHRHSLPEYVETNGDVHHRHESVVERPTVRNGEPLTEELAAFVAAVSTGSPPLVTAEDGLRALDVATRVDALAAGRPRREVLAR